ncbi:MAG TPA: vitamin K epoxide reductase family protein [Streptosporangiaceae bacterium]|nr:vitamin K epoxide reductase family protein [Streptosporangiaceae bacterium]
MTASKSSRARQARARAQAQAQRGQATARNGSTANASTSNGSTARAGTVAKPGTAAKPGTVAKASTLVQAASPARAVATRGGSLDRRGARGLARQQETTAEPEAPSTTTIPVWFQLTTWILSLAGLGVSIYLTIAHFTDQKLAACAESGAINCTKVTTSPQSYVFGIPVAVLGLAFFVAAVALMSPWAWRWARREVALIRIASLVVGVGFVLYLVYTELFTIGAICLYCTSVHVITFLLFVLTAFAAAAWGLPERQRG